MKFDIYKPAVTPTKLNRLAQVGDVYQMRGGRHGSDCCWVVVSTDKSRVSVFGVNKDTGEIVSAANYRRDYFNHLAPIGRADLPNKIELHLIFGE